MAIKKPSQRAEQEAEQFLAAVEAEVSDGRAVVPDLPPDQVEQARRFFEDERRALDG